MRRIFGKGLGWYKDLPDIQDHTIETDSVAEILSQSARLKKVAKALPDSVSLKEWCSPIEDQGDLGSCTAHAGVGMLEYFERSVHGRHLDASRLFLYKVTRQLMGFSGDDGAYLRDTMKAMVVFGIPPERFWPYVPARFNDDPTPFCFAYAQSYKAIDYYRLDTKGTSSTELLKRIRTNLAARLPSVFGFTVYSSMPPLGDGKGEIPYPTTGDKVDGCHAVLAVGNNDKKKIGKCTGALLIRNSWGSG